ncbi:MAG: hypothetical protein ACI8ZX_000905 [Planctomycetota bacterium]|jgi:hypothetical protein
MNKLLILFVTAISLVACNNETKTTAQEIDSTVAHSKYYLEVIKKAGGDFSGFNLGDKVKVAQEVLGEQNLVEKEADYLFYKFEETYSNADYEIFFKDGRLNEILLDAYIYDETGNFDRAASAVLFNEIKDDFLKRFGNKYMETSDEKNEILYWSKDKKNIQLIHEVSKAAVHVYLDKSEFEE